MVYFHPRWKLYFNLWKCTLLSMTRTVKQAEKRQPHACALLCPLPSPLPRSISSNRAFCWLLCMHQSEFTCWHLSRQPPFNSSCTASHCDLSRHWARNTRSFQKWCFKVFRIHFRVTEYSELVEKKVATNPRYSIVKGNRKNNSYAYLNIKTTL